MDEGNELAFEKCKGYRVLQLLGLQVATTALSTHSFSSFGCVRKGIVQQPHHVAAWRCISQPHIPEEAVSCVVEWRAKFIYTLVNCDVDVKQVMGSLKVVTRNLNQCLQAADQQFHHLLCGRCL